MLSRNEMATLAQSSALGGRLIRGFSRVTPGAFLSRTELENLLAGAVRTTVIAGGAAGNHAITGIEVGDALRAVLDIDVSAAVNADTSGTTELAEIAGGEVGIGAGGTVPRTWAVADLTGEFSISAADTINNAGGTVTTGHILLVVYEDLTP